MLTLEMNYAEIIRELQRIEQLCTSQEFDCILTELLTESDDMLDMLETLRRRLEEEAQ